VRRQVRHLGSPAADYPGPGKGQVLLQVKQGDTVSDIGPRAEGQGSGGVGRRIQQRLARQDRYPGRLLPAEEEE